MEITDFSDTVPVQYQEGRTTFKGVDILVDERVLIPRPETELIVDAAVGLLGGKRTPKILDLCTGSGAISVAIALGVADAEIVASDVSLDALDVARKNIGRYGLGSRIDLVASDMFGAFGPRYKGFFDCIVSNPPYVSDADYEKVDEWVKAEPKIALCAGPRGMDYLKVIARESARFLAEGGFVAVEVGYDQADMVKKEFSMCEFVEIRSIRDFNGYERVIIGQKNG